MKWHPASSWRHHRARLWPIFRNRYDGKPAAGIGAGAVLGPAPHASSAHRGRECGGLAGLNGLAVMGGACRKLFRKAYSLNSKLVAAELGSGPSSIIITPEMPQPGSDRSIFERTFLGPP